MGQNAKWEDREITIPDSKGFVRTQGWHKQVRIDGIDHVIHIWLGGQEFACSIESRNGVHRPKLEAGQSIGTHLAVLDEWVKYQRHEKEIPHGAPCLGTEAKPVKIDTEEEYTSLLSRFHSLQGLSAEGRLAAAAAAARVNYSKKTSNERVAPRTTGLHPSHAAPYGKGEVTYHVKPSQYQSFHEPTPKLHEWAIEYTLHGADKERKVVAAKDFGHALRIFWDETGLQQTGAEITSVIKRGVE